MPPMPTFSVRVLPELRKTIQAVAVWLRTHPEKAGELIAWMENTTATRPQHDAILSRLNALEADVARLKAQYGVLPAVLQASREDLEATLPPGPGNDLGEDSFGKRLKASREKAGLSQRKLASIAGMSQSTLSNLESGRSDPTPEQRAALLAVLQIAVEE